MDTAYSWPLFFARLPLTGTRITIPAGSIFPFQDRPTIRGFGEAYGVEGADTCPFRDLPYVSVLNVHTEEMRQLILQRGLTYDEACALLEPPPAPASSREETRP